MDPNKLTLNPGADIDGKLVCSHCGEEIVEVATDKQNYFKCGCEQRVEFDIPTVDHTSSDEEDDWLPDDGFVANYEDRSCSKCDGTGVVTLYLGQVSGTVECDRCDGSGEEPIADIT